MKDIQDLINLTIKDKHTKLNLAQYNSSEKLEKYKSVIIEYVNLKNKEAEVNK